MTEMTTEARLFRVRARHEDAHHGRVLNEPSFEAAAIAYAEHLPVPAGHPAEIAIVVRDLHSGHEHSFVVHLDHEAGRPTV